MASDKDNGKNLFGRPRRSSFVAASEENADFVPILPAVGSTPIPAASDVNYFPTVETGQPSLREPAPPARLVVPTRKSMTEEEIATVFVDASAMSSTEQIAMLDAQVTLRHEDLRTAKEFVAVLKTANPTDAVPMLEELKVKFADVDPEIAELSLTDDSVPASTVSDAVEAAVASSPAAAMEKPAPAVPAPNAPVAQPIVAPTDDAAVPGRYRGWSVVLFVATAIAALVPITAAVFTTFGSPVPAVVDSLLGASGAFIAILAILVSVPLVILARAVAVRNALTWRAALTRVTGTVGGSVFATLVALFMVFGVFSALLVTSQGVGLQLGSIPGVASALSTFAPQAHVTVIVVSILVALGFVTASLSRQLFRAKILALAGFMIAGPAVVLLTGLAVLGNTDSGVVVSLDNVVLATGVIPLAITLFAATESGAATVLRHDEKKLHGLWLYIGLALGISFAAWVLLSRMGSDAVGSIFVGSNPALHVIATTNELAFIIGAIAFAVPVIFLSALVGRTVMMTFVSDDRHGGQVWFRLIIVAIPLVVLALDVTGIVGDITVVLPGIAFVSVPLMAVTGLMAGASVVSRRSLTGAAKVINAVITLIVTVAGLALTTWTVPTLAGFYAGAVAPFATTLGLSGTTGLVVPVGVLIVTFLISLLVSAFGAVRSDRADA